jgi:NADH-quinone oxidoreductase subunit J
MTFSDIIFYAFAVIAVLPALAILFVPGIVRMAFLLLFSLAGFAGLYLQLGAGFLGFTQVVVYIGGILILFLFGVMLTARIDLPVRERIGPALLVPGVFAGLMILGGVLFLALGTPWLERVPGEAHPVAAAPAPEAAPPPGLPPPPRVPRRDPETSRIGVKLLGAYVLPFEAVSVLLLVAMIGATYIARSRAEEGERE